MREGKVPREVYGELSEWLKEHDWKSCIREKRIPGSNPGLSAIFEPVARARVPSRSCLWHMLVSTGRGGRAAECGGLENRLPSFEGTGVQIPPSPPVFSFKIPLLPAEINIKQRKLRIGLRY